MTFFIIPLASPYLRFFFNFSILTMDPSSFCISRSLFFATFNRDVSSSISEFSSSSPPPSSIAARSLFTFMSISSASSNLSSSMRDRTRSNLSSVSSVSNPSSFALPIIPVISSRSGVIRSMASFCRSFSSFSSFSSSDSTRLPFVSMASIAAFMKSFSLKAFIDFCSNFLSSRMDIPAAFTRVSISFASENLSLAATLSSFSFMFSIMDRDSSSFSLAVSISDRDRLSLTIAISLWTGTTSIPTVSSCSVSDSRFRRSVVNSLVEAISPYSDIPAWNFFSSASIFP